MDGQKDATQSNTTSSEFLQPLMSCFRQYMGGSNTVMRILSAERVPALELTEKFFG